LKGVKYLNIFKMMQHILSLFKRTKKEYDLKSFAAAGCIFTNGTHVLAGLQKKNMISGIGGSRKDGELYFTTAIRETIEELFDINLSANMLNKIKSYLSEQKVFMNGAYVCIQCSFEDLEEIAFILSVEKLQSPLYEEFPLTVADIIMKRNVTGNSAAEVQELYLLPLKNNYTVDRQFLADIRKCINNTA
jgi:hypothetical protein